MRSFLVNTIAAVPVLFREGGEPFIPDANSAKWHLRDHAGALALSNQNITLGLTDTQTVVQVPALQNTITSPRQFEKRTLIVTATRQGGIPWEMRVAYRVSPWLNHTVTINSVRSLAGLAADELHEDDVDIYAAYKWIEEKITATTLETALASGTADETNTNRAIASKALLEALPAVSMRMLKRKTDGSLEAERFEQDLAALRDMLQRNVDTVVTDLGSVETANTSLFSFGLPTDPITGV